MDRTIVAVFDSQEHAEQARQQLVALGIPEKQVHVRQGTTSDIPHADAGRTPAFSSEGDTSKRPGFFARLFGLDDDSEDDDLSGGYDEAMRRGSCIVAVDRVPDELVDRASQVLSQHGAIDMDERVAGWRERGWSGYDENAPRLSDDDLTRERDLDRARCNIRTGAEVDAERGATANLAQGGDTQATGIPVIEEQLAVGKRVVQRGAVRIYTRVVEQPVEEQVTLHEERARVERHPVDREATQAELGQAFREGSMEIVETEEQPVVSKTARVVEEVEVGKEQRDRTETVRDTVRRSQVDVEELPASRPSPDRPDVKRPRR